MTDADLSTPAASADADLSLGRLAHYVGFRLRRIQNQLSRDFNAATGDLGLRSGLFSALVIIEANPGVSQIAVAREIGLDKSLTVSVVAELERRGLAIRERSVSDRRRHALRVTPAGSAFLDRVFERLAMVERSVLASLSDAERSGLNGALDRIYETCFRDGD